MFLFTILTVSFIRNDKTAVIARASPEPWPTTGYADLLIRLAYISLCTVAPELAEKELEGILDVSSSRNSEVGVTGALLYTGGYFAQLLEGDDIGVESTFMRIQSDARNRNCKILVHEPCAMRYLPDHPMGFAGFTPEPYPEIAKAVEAPGSIKINEAGENVVRFLTRQVTSKYQPAVQKPGIEA